MLHMSAGAKCLNEAGAFFDQSDFTVLRLHLSLFRGSCSEVHHAGTIVQGLDSLYLDIT